MLDEILEPCGLVTMSGTAGPAFGRDALPIVAVGGGLAGAAFAIELARHGRRVVVLERTQSPCHKVCGEFLSEETQGLLASLGLDLGALGATPIARFRLVKGEREATSPLPFAAAGLSRHRLDHALLSLAERAGATVVRGTAVTGLEAEVGGVSVRTQRGSWQAAAVALATGKHSVRGFARPPGAMVGFKLHFEATAAARHLAGIVQLVFFRGGYVGACLIEEGTLSVAWVMNASLLREVGASWLAQKEHLARQSSWIGDLIAGARPLFAKPVAVAAIPHGFLRCTPVAQRVYPVGDQLAVVPSFTGDGMAVALYSGVAAARALLTGKTADAYQRDLVRELRPQFQLARAVGRLLETPMTCAISVAAARFFPSLATTVATATRLHGLQPSTVEQDSPGSREQSRRYASLP